MLLTGSLIAMSLYGNKNDAKRLIKSTMKVRNMKEHQFRARE